MNLGPPDFKSSAHATLPDMQKLPQCGYQNLTQWVRRSAKEESLPFDVWVLTSIRSNVKAVQIVAISSQM